MHWKQMKLFKELWQFLIVMNDDVEKCWECDDRYIFSKQTTHG
jgi:hypothetical protein